jgi:hypothetical protein
MISPAVSSCIAIEKGSGDLARQHQSADIKGSPKHTKESSMQRERTTDTQVDIIHHYLEREFPGQVNHTWWDDHAHGPVFEMAHGPVRHQIAVASAFLEACPDYTDSLRSSELVDYIREARAQDRRFLILWQGDAVRIRSKPL